MAFGLGVLLFAFGILISIALHEAGHMFAARAFKMRVRRYFIGFGPTLWSTKQKARQHATAGGVEAAQGVEPAHGVEATEGAGDSDPARVAAEQYAAAQEFDTEQYDAAQQLNAGAEQPEGEFKTEYGVKAIPLGGFCEIAGMTPLDELTEEEKPHAMYLKPWWQRVIVLAGGIAVNVLVALIVLYSVANIWGLPDHKADITTTVQSTQCAPATQNPDGTLSDCTGEGPAAEAGIRAGDTITEVDGREVPTFPDFTKAIDRLVAGEATQRADQAPGTAPEQGLKVGDTLTVPMRVQHPDGTDEVTQVGVEIVERLNKDGSSRLGGAIGITIKLPGNVEYNPVSAVGGTLSFTGYMVSETAKGLVSLPAKVPGVVASIFGAERADDSPMSIVGASRIGGELVEHNQWHSFLMMLASLNLFLAAFNLVPLPPLDGGHVAVALYGGIRDRARRARGLEPGEPVDYRRLLPLTYAVALLLMIFGAIVIVADVLNPVRLF